MRAVFLIVLLYVVLIVIVLLFVVVFAEPADAARVYRLDQHRIEIWRNGQATTIGQYLKWRKDAVYASTTAYSNRRGDPAGLFILKGYIHQGNLRRRCFFQVDRTGRRVWIGYGLRDDLHYSPYDAFAAGPCIVRWNDGQKSGVYIAEREERFRHSFVTAAAERSVWCTDRTGSIVVPFRFRGPLWTIAKRMQEYDLDRCINTDGGSQLRKGARNPAILGIIADPIPGPKI